MTAIEIILVILYLIIAFIMTGVVHNTISETFDILLGMIWPITIACCTLVVIIVGLVMFGEKIGEFLNRLFG